MSRLKRTWVYLQAMFPLPVMIPGGVVNVAALYFGLQALNGSSAGPGGPLQLTWRMALASAGVVLFSLLMRVYDELKDLETDARLAAAGDPRYTDRPLVTGAVEAGDVIALRWWTTGLLVAVTAPLGPTAWIAGAVVFAFMWLSFKWFFWPAIQQNLLLAFVTHNPVSLLIGGYVAAAYLSDFPRPVADLSPWTAALLVGMWLPVAAWEIGRKVRLPEQETDYDTYSRRLGWRGATCAVGLFVLGAAGCLGGVSLALGLRGLALGVAASALVPLFACARLLLAPTPARTNLRPWIEAFLVLVSVGLVVGLGFHYGVRP